MLPRYLKNIPLFFLLLLTITAQAGIRSDRHATLSFARIAVHHTATFSDDDGEQGEIELAARYSLTAHHQQVVYKKLFCSAGDLLLNIGVAAKQLSYPVNHCFATGSSAHLALIFPFHYFW